MCTDLCPELQEEEHARILPALIAVMDDFDNPRVQAHSAAAVVNFTEGGSQVRQEFLSGIGLTTVPIILVKTYDCHLREMKEPGFDKHTKLYASCWSDFCKSP